MHEAEIIGRDPELQAISGFLEASADSGALLIEGNAGIGKTTLWRCGVARAEHRGWKVLTAAPAASEARLPKPRALVRFRPGALRGASRTET